MKNIILILIVSASSVMAEKNLLIFAASSTREIIEYAAEMFSRDNTPPPLINFDSSGRLARQIEMGADADIFISASAEWKDYILKKKIVASDKSFEFAENALALIINNQAITTRINKDARLAEKISFLKKDAYFSIGDPSCVPAGKYARESLIFHELYKKIKPQLIPAKNVRQALLNIDKGICSMGIVYKSDAILLENSSIMHNIPSKSHSPIKYYALQLKENNRSSKFIKIILSTECRNFAVNRGFK